MKTTRNIRYLALLFSLSLATSLAQAEPDRDATEINAAIRHGDRPKLEALIKDTASVNARDAVGDTPLMKAAVYATAAEMTLLLNHGADVNATNQFGATALMRAAYDADKVELLLQRGASVNGRSALGNTALILAARAANSHRAVELLLNHGAEANATNNFGASTLMAAAASGDAESVRLLIKHGADVNARGAFSRDSFILGGGRSPLMWAAFRGNLTVMRLLLDAGANVNAPAAIGTPLAQAAWNDQTEAAKLLIEHGANVNQVGQPEGYTPLHWAASTEVGDASLVKLLLSHGANPNIGGGEDVDAFMGTLQTPLMLAMRRGDTAVLAALREGGATAGTPDRAINDRLPQRSLPEKLDAQVFRDAVERAMPPLQYTSLESKKSFVRHASRQDCTSCHQQHLPMAATGMARKFRAAVDHPAEVALINMVKQGDLKNMEIDWEPLFHPDAVHTKGYALLACATEDVPADEKIDSWVHHLSVIQGPEGQWYNNLPRPPIQTGDAGATALAVQALQRYPLPGRQAEFAERINRARHWLWGVKPDNTEARVYQLLGLAWSGVPKSELQDLAKQLAAEQRADGGWAQLPAMQSDAYATAQAVYTLRMSAGLSQHDSAVERGLRYLLSQQLDDGTWHVRRRAFPFQPTMDSGFPHGRDSWISAAASSWAVMALSIPEAATAVALKQQR